MGIKEFRKDNVVLQDSSAWGSFGSFSGFGSGDEGRTVMRCSGENPPINLSPQRVVATSIALAPNFAYPQLGGAGANSVPFAQGGGNTDIPGGQKTYYEDATAAGNYGTLLSNPAYNFVTDTGEG